MASRVLFICHGYAPSYKLGGPINSVKCLAEYLWNSKIISDIEVFCTTDNLNDFIEPKEFSTKIRGVKVNYFNSISFYFFKVFGKKIKDQYLSFSLIAALISHGGKFDFIHTHIPLSFLGLVACIFCRLRKIPFFYHIRGCYSPGRLKNFGVLKKTLDVKC